MRLWHEKLIPKLPRMQLLGQNRENAALRGLGWGKKHSIVNYVFKYSKLYHYHVKIMNEMKKRGYKPSSEWYDITYRGKRLGYDTSFFTDDIDNSSYIEHNDEYLKECLNNLKEKGIILEEV